MICNKINVYFVIAILLFNFNSKINSQVFLNNINDEKIIKLYILGSEEAQGKYIEGNLKMLGFTEYDNKTLPYIEYDRKMYTFRGTFNLDNNLKNEYISIYMGPADYPFLIYLNGKVIFKKGSFGKYYKSIIYDSSNIYLPNYLLNYGDKGNEIAVEIFPNYERRPLSKIILCSYLKNNRNVFYRNLFNVNLIQGSCIIALILFFYFLFLFFGSRLKDLKYLYFSLTCFFYIFCYFNISYSHDLVNEVLNEKISRIGFPLTTMFLAIFIIEYSKLFIKNIFLKIVKYILIFIITVPSILISIVTLIQDTKYKISIIFDITMNFVLPPILLLTIVIVLIYVIKSVFKDRKYEPLIILFGFIAVFITSYTDLQNNSKELIPYAWTVPYGYLILVLSIFITLSVEQSRTFILSEKKSNELNKKNRALKKLMNNIKIVSDDLIRSSGKLEEITDNTINVIKEYRESNSQIMNSLLNQFGYVELMINQITKRIDTSTERIPRAIKHQIVAVEDVNNTINKMNNHIEQTFLSSEESNRVASQLSIIADESSKIVIESKKSIDKIYEYSGFINKILNSIEDITGKTNLLSINASIEAANKGDMGKGFSVIANEIRNLAVKSQNSLYESFDSINKMMDIIKLSRTLSDDVYQRLFKILDESKKSAENINNITNLINEQKNRSENILSLTESLLDDTVEIENLSIEEQKDNEMIKKSLMDLKNTFVSITDILSRQQEKEEELNHSIINIKDVMSNSLKNIDILNDSLRF